LTIWLVGIKGIYAVYMRPNATPAGESYTLSAQVTIKAPHGEGADRFVVTNLQSAVADAIWVQSARVDAPPEDPQADYISFTFDPLVMDAAAFGALRRGNLDFATTANDLRAYTWRAGEAVKLFTFANGGTERGSVTLLENDDPFLAPNSAGTNPGNQIAILGLDVDNAYVGNYTAASEQAPGIFLPLINR